LIQYWVYWRKLANLSEIAPILGQCCNIGQDRPILCQYCFYYIVPIL